MDYQILICEDELITPSIIAAGINACPRIRDKILSAGISVEYYCLNSYTSGVIENMFPGILMSSLTQTEAENFADALTDAGYTFSNNVPLCYAIPMKMGDNITCSIKDGIVTVSGSGKMKDFSGSFRNNTSPMSYLHKIYLYNGYLSVTKGYNYDYYTTETKVEGNITTIGQNAFYYAFTDKVTLPDTIKTIDNDGFVHSDIKEINLPDSLEYIGENAFYGTQIKSISIPAKTQMEGNPFATTPLITITLDSGNPYYKLVDSVLFSKDGKTLVCYPYDGKSSAEYTVPDGVEVIGKYAFSRTNLSVATLKKLTLPEGVTTIKSCAFWNIGLKEIVLPDSIKTIESYAFGDNPKLEKVWYTRSNYSAINIAGINKALTEVTPTLYGSTSPEKPETPETPENPCKYAKINVAAEKTVDYRTKVTIIATASNVPEGYILVMTVNGKDYRGNNEEVTCEYGEIKGDITYSVKVIDANGAVQKGADGNDLTKDGGKITCKAGFIQKLVAFFKGLFGSLPSELIKPVMR